MAYDQRSSYVIGVVLLLCGLGSSILGVVAIFVCTSHYRWFAAPIWSGVIAALTGLVGIVSGKKKEIPGKYIISSFLVLNVITTVTSLTSWIISILGILDDKSATEGAVKASRAVFAVSVMLGVTEMMLAACAVLMGCAGVYCYKQKKETPRNCEASISDSDSSEYYTLQPGDQVIEAADGNVVIVSEGQVIHPGTCQIKVVAKETQSIPPPYGIGDVDATDILQPEGVATQLPPYSSQECQSSTLGAQATGGRTDTSRPQATGGRPNTPPPDVVLKQPPTDFVEPSLQLPRSSNNDSSVPLSSHITELS
ncbi:uncharacterized protein LOC144439043 [Glandiceps talaboti]